jgi:hypothetical protein
MSNTKTVMGQASNQYVAPTDITDVFSTYVYEGTSAEHTITNGIDLAGEGGMIWGKVRSGTDQHWLVDSERGTGSNNNYKYLMSNLANGELDFASRSVSSFNSNGFTLQNGTDHQFNESGQDYVSWTFRKAPKFFDVVTYTGTGSAQNISHDLGSVPGTIIVKRTSAAEDWLVYHRSTGNQAGTGLNETAATYTGVGNVYWNSTDPTDSVFTVGTHARVNTSGQTYVAYLFAHNDGDGGFGPSGDQDIIKCGSYTGAALPNEINVGFEPQWVMIKRTSGTGDWMLFDSMRGVVNSASPNLDNTLFANTSAAERTNTGYIGFTPTGFLHQGGSGDTNTSGQTYAYMAIRRGPLAAPTAGTEVFHIQSQSNADTYSVGFPNDLILLNKTGGSSANTYVGSRLSGDSKYLVTSSTAAEGSSAGLWSFDLQNSFDQGASTSSPWVGYHWKRSPGYFDVVAYTGNSTAGRTVSHNLGVAPEMMWVKSRDATTPWAVYHKDIGNTKSLRLNDTNASATENFWNGTTPTADTFTLGANGEVNYPSSRTYIAYLFASLPGISKVGSVSHTGGSATNVDCGFTAGCRFLILKRTDAVSDWWVFDTVRGITSGNDARLLLNSTSAETSTDQIDPYSAGFTIDGNRATGEYIFYAIA